MKDMLKYREALLKLYLANGGLQMQGNVFSKEIKMKSSVLALLILALIGSMSAVGILIKDSPDIIISKEDDSYKKSYGISDTDKESDESKEENEVAEEIKVYVVGEVNKPGVVTIVKGQIVKDALDLAGGTTENADVENINLAYELKENVMLRIKTKAEVSAIIDQTALKKNEGSQIALPPQKSTANEVNQATNRTTAPSQVAGSVSKSTSPSPKVNNKANEPYDKTLLAGMDIIKDSGGAVVEEKEGKDKSEAKININTSTAEELDLLPGIGPSTATKIITYRQKNGEFKKIEDIMEVSGIGESKFDSIRDYITID
jgi:competence protein ComEA